MTSIYEMLAEVDTMSRPREVYDAYDRILYLGGDSDILLDHALKEETPHRDIILSCLADNDIQLSAYNAERVSVLLEHADRQIARSAVLLLASCGVSGDNILTTRKDIAKRYLKSIEHDQVVLV